MNAVSSIRSPCASRFPRARSSRRRALRAIRAGFVATLATLAIAAAPARAHTADELGQVDFPNSCAESVQPAFQRAVALLHSFWWDEADRAFREVLRDDPSCGIAAWGIATVAIANPFATGATPASARAAEQAIAQGRAIGAGTERERGYVEAIAAYYDHFSERSHPVRMRSLADAFEALANRFPDDDETQIFTALYLAATQNPSDKTFARATLAVAILTPLYARHPDHPGIAHYLIHANDYPPIAEHGLLAALCYAGIAPAAPHALHMPSHIFTRVGLWQDSDATNRRSVAAAKADGLITDQLHAYDYMIYADLQLARDADAAAVVAESATLGEPNRAADYARAAIPARYAIERNQWQEPARLPDPDPSPFPYTSAIRFFARALGAARSGDPDAAERDLARLRDLEASLKAANDTYWTAEVETQRLAAAAWIAQARGDRDAALKLMRAAAANEDLSEKSAVSPGRLIPARELLGDMLLQDGQPAAALVAYEASMTRDPKRFRGLAGAADAAARAGDTTKAGAYDRQLLDMAGKAGPRPELAAARTRLAAK